MLLETGFDHYVLFVKELQFENWNWKMPFYDGIGVIAEKHAVVLDIGSAFTKGQIKSEWIYEIVN